jgi:hypothetical protein
MPRLACWTCGSLIYATSPLQSLFHDERRCPRCGAPMNPDRRQAERRVRARRRNPAGDPGPPAATGERRAGERRAGHRRRQG